MFHVKRGSVHSGQASGPALFAPFHTLSHFCEVFHVKHSKFYAFFTFALATLLEPCYNGFALPFLLLYFNVYAARTGLLLSAGSSGK